jgi:tetratricopeptide (TPR) repeat protein
MKSIRTLLLLAVSVFVSLPLSAQEYNREVTDAEGQAKLLGPCTREGLQKAPYAEWFQANYEAYAPNEALFQYCQSNLDGVEIEIFLGTWCGDSRREVPRFYKIMDQLGMPDSQLHLIALDNESAAYKQSPSDEEVGKLIHRVPTFIIYRDGEEVGRIVETPHTSFEMDLSQILQGLPSAPNYKIVPRLDQILETQGIPEDRKELFEIARAIQHDSWNDGELNTYAYVLMGRNEFEKAIAVLTINAMLYRNVANVWDSLGEALGRNGQFEEAISMYEVALELDPGNENARDQIAKLKAKL